jgi:hypothetical protein
LYSFVPAPLMLLHFMANQTIKSFINIKLIVTIMLRKIFFSFDGGVI